MAATSATEPPALSGKALREKRAPLVKTMRDIVDKVHAEGRDLTAEEKPNWEKLNADYNALTRSIELAEHVEKMESEQRSPANENPPGRENRDTRDNQREDRGGRTKPTEEHRALVIQAWMRKQEGLPLKKEHKEACRITGVRPNKRFLDIGIRRDYQNVRREFRALSAVAVGTGGALVAPEGFVGPLEMALLQWNGVRQVANVIRTGGGGDLPFPTFNDTGNKGRRLGENTTTNDVDATTGEMNLHAYKYTSDMQKVPAELIEDDAFALTTFLGDALGTRIGRIQADEFTTGTGNAMPMGLATAAYAALTAASATVIAADEVLKLIHKLDPAYRVGAGFMCHDAILLALRLLKDGEGRWIFQESAQAGEPDRLFKYPLTINQSMAGSIAASAKTLLFGQYQKFKIRDAGTVRLRRLVERFADTDQEGFVMFQRSDAGLLDAGTHPVVALQQAAS